MTKVVRIHEFGGTDVLSIEDDEIGAPGPGEVLLDQKGMALHFADTMLREGKYHLKPELPAVVGLDGAGVVEAVGDGVTDFKPGDSACYMFNLGAYAEKRIIAAEALMPVPAGVDPKNLAGTFLRGMTAQYLLRQTYRVRSGDTVLIHTAAGGMGTLLCQWAKALGATVIGTVGSDDKKDIASVATISAADATVGEVIADAIDKVGKDGVVTVEESNTFGMDLDFVEGMQFDKGYLSPYFVTDAERQEAVLDEPYILFNQGKISNVQDLLPVLEKVMQSGKPLLIIAEDVEGEALARAVEQRALDDHIGAVDKALALGEREREKGQGRCGVVEAQPDLLCGKDLAEIDLEPPVLYGGARRWSPAGSGIAVEGTEGRCRRGARTAIGPLPKKLVTTLPTR